MVGDHHLDPEVVMKLSSQLAHLRLATKQSVGRGKTERENKLRPDELELLEQVRHALLDLETLRRTVARRSALEDVRDVHVLAPQIDSRQNLVEKLPRQSDKWLTDAILVRSRRLADHDDV